MKRTSILLVIAGMLLLSFFISLALAPVTKSKEYQKLVDADSVFTQNFNSLFYEAEMKSLIKEKAYKEALLKLSESDSIQLVVNLADSTVGLSIKGVGIHQTRIREFSIDKFLERLPLSQEIKILSQPLPVISQYATIVKEPVVVRQAPKDTLEASLNAWQPDTLVQKPAYVSLLAQYDLQIILEQDNRDQFRDLWSKFAFYSHLRTRKGINSVKDFLSFSRQQYRPTITIKMPVDDLRSIYRALPDSTLIVLKL